MEEEQKVVILLIIGLILVISYVFPKGESAEDLSMKETSVD